MVNTVTLPQLAWHNAKELKIQLDSSWQVEICNMAGFNQKAMSSEEIKSAIANPIGIKPIRELAKNRKEVAIIFDDMSRVTRVAQIIPHIIKELAEAGIPDRSIRFIAALGCHGTMNRLDFVKKLGEETLSRFPVYNHNAFGNCTYVGSTSLGTKVFINAEVMKCDLKIAIGSIVPHIFSGFAGGAKIIMPGITSIDTTEAFHRLGDKFRKEQPDKPIGIGIWHDNPLRLDMEEAAKLAGLDIKIDCILNMWGETTSIFAGAPDLEWAAAVEKAKTHYLTPRTQGNDIVIANTFAKVSEAEGGLITAFPAVNREGGDIVLICNAPEGHVSHYLMGSWGNNSKSRMNFRINLPKYVNHLIIFSEYLDFTIVGCYSEPDKLILMNKWNNVLKLLQEFHKKGAKVAVYPNSDIQYCN